MLFRSDVLHLVQEPAVDLGQVVEAVHRVARTQGRRQHKDPLVCGRLQLLGTGGSEEVREEEGSEEVKEGIEEVKEGSKEEGSKEEGSEGEGSEEEKEVARRRRW